MAKLETIGVETSWQFVIGDSCYHQLSEMSAHPNRTIDRVWAIKDGPHITLATVVAKQQRFHSNDITIGGNVAL